MRLSCFRQIFDKTRFEFDCADRTCAAYVEDVDDTGVDAGTVYNPLDGARKYVHPDGMMYIFVGDRSEFDGDISQFGPVHEIILNRETGTSTIRR